MGPEGLYSTYFVGTLTLVLALVVTKWVWTHVLELLYITAALLFVFHFAYSLYLAGVRPVTPDQFADFLKASQVYFVDMFKRLNVSLH